MNGLIDFAMPYLIQFMRDYAGKVDALVEDKKDRNNKEVAKEKEAVDQQMNQNMYVQLLPAALPAPGMETTQGMSGMGVVGGSRSRWAMLRHGHARDGIPAGILIDDSSRHDRALEL